MAIPVANDDLSYTIYEDQILRVNVASGVLDNDTDADGDKLAARVLTSPINPLFDFETNGSFIYDTRYHGALWLDGDGKLIDDDGGDADLPDGFDSLAAGAEIYDEYTYAANDGQDDSEATVRITITGVNDDPVAANDFLELVQGSMDSVEVLANDTDVDVWPTPDSETFAIIGLADIADDGGPAGGSDSDLGDGLTIVTDAGGTVTLVGGELQYEAAEDFFGVDTFEYTLSDGHGGTDTATVRVTVLPENDAPDAVDDDYTVSEDATATTFATVLGNDTDADDAPLIAADLIDPIASALRRVDEFGATIGGSTGILVDFNSDGTFEFNPNGEFESLGVGDSAYVAFDYTAYDGLGASDTATVTIEIQGENDNPTGESPDAVQVYEAGLSNGSGDGTTTFVQNIDITINDVDASDTPYVAGTTGGDTTTLNGTYGTLAFSDADTVQYTLTSNADHAAVQGHNGGIYDTFTVYVVDEHGGYSGPLTVTVEVIDDINFLVTQPNGGGTGDDLDDTSLNFTIDATAVDTFTLIAGADGQTLDIVGAPGDFELNDGRTVTSWIYSDSNGNEAVRGTDSDGATFYEIEFDPDYAEDTGQYTLTLFQDPPIVRNPVDFESVSAGGPQEVLTVENISFNGYFFAADADWSDLLSYLWDDGPDDTTGDDDVNPNNAGGAGIGNGNIELYEALSVDVTASTAEITGLELDLQGVGGGISGSLGVLWAAVDDGVVVAYGEEFTTDINVKGGETVVIDPDVEFDQLYIGLNPDDIDSNDKARINNIYTRELQSTDDILLGFRVNSDDGDGDHSPVDPGYEEFTVTILGDNGGEIDPGIDLI